ncbi:ABC transporter ATP-binding protein [Natronoglycomyces albus]|uniref:ABC transporter ATP-binding protein n=1 Tax=Natronoglycomyces albus TaxID=2811108 RepID=UPI003CCDED5B
MKLELRALTKKFGTFVADDNIDLVVQPGEIHALLGENGAGKSTLMNMLYGLLEPTSGEILIDDEPVTFDNPKQAIRAGIGMVHQHFMLVPPFTVAENVMLGREYHRYGVLNRKAARQAVMDVSERYGLRVDPDALIKDIPVGVQQRVEIIKALLGDCRLLIMDEPTAVLTPQEITELLDIMRTLAESGTSIIFISHKLKEVKAIADKITVIRRGKVTGDLTPDVSEMELASAMVGRDVSLTVDKGQSTPADSSLEIRDLTVIDERDCRAVDGLDLTVRRGEILGIAGVEGNGQTELARALIGLAGHAADGAKEKMTGSIKFHGREVSRSSPLRRIRLGLGYIPEDRARHGLIKDFTVAENLVLNQIGDEPYSRNGVRNFNAIHELAERSISTFDIRTEGPDKPASSLSGGNQQKLIIAREFSRKLELLVASQPTRGVDVGAIEFIHKRIIEERDAGAGVLLISSELDEILSLSDRVAVMYKGKVVAVVPPDTPREVIGRYMAGAVQEGVDATIPDAVVTLAGGATVGATATDDVAAQISEEPAADAVVEISDHDDPETDPTTNDPAPEDDSKGGDK